MISDLWAGKEEGCRRLLPPAARWCAARVDLVELARHIELLGEAAVAGQYLVAPERLCFDGFRLPKRRLEWLGGRIAAKHAAKGLAGVGCQAADWLRWRVETLPSGRPVLAEWVGERAEISISHSGSEAVAMAAEHACGVDIQQCSERLVRVKSRFCSAVEEERLVASLPGVEIISCLNLLWAAKEAVRKALPVTPLASFEETELLAVGGDPPAQLVLDICYRRRGTMTVLRCCGGLHANGYALVLTEVVAPSMDPASAERV